MVDIIGRAKVVVESTFDKSSLDTGAGTLGSTLKKTAVVGVAALGGLAVAGVHAFKSFEEAEAVSRKLNTVLGNMGKIGAADSVDKLASSLQRVTGVDDEVIKGGQTILATFSNVAESAGEVGGTFERATRASLDIAAAMGTDVRGASVQLGKALQDPVKGVTALNRAGVTFTATQKEQIKNFVRTGDVAAAQNLILKEVEKQVGGTAEAQATGTERLKSAVGELEESFGSLISEATDGRLKNLPDVIFDAADKLKAFAESDDWQTITTNIATMLDGIHDAKQFLFPDDVEPVGTGTVLAPGAEVKQPLQDAFNQWGQESGESFWQGVVQSVLTGNPGQDLGDGIFELMTHEDIGSVLIDAFRAGWHGFDEWFIEVTEDWRDGFWKWWDDVETQFDDGWAALGSFWRTKVGQFKTTVRETFLAYLRSIPGEIRETAGEWASAGGKLITSFIGGFQNAVRDHIGADFKSILNNALGLPRTITLGDGKGGVIPDFSVTLKAFADGVRNFGGGLALVGERGPEVVALPGGSSVYSNEESRGMVGDTHLNFYGPTSLAEARFRQAWANSGTRFGAATLAGARG